MPRVLLTLTLLMLLPLLGLASTSSDDAAPDDSDADADSAAPEALPSADHDDLRELQRERETSFFGGPFGLDLRAGYTGTMWRPGGLGPYEVKTYGRNLLYAELAIHHPLLIVNDALDIVEIPRLRLETNFGYSSRSAGFTDMIPELVRGNPYLRTTAWMTFWQFFSFRYREERFDVTLENPNYVAGLINAEYVYGSLEMTNKIRDLEIGMIGSPDGEIHDTMMELGYYNSRFAWPLVQKAVGDFGHIYVLNQTDYVVQGLYLSLNTTPIPRVWPVYSQLMVRVGDAFGFDARFKFEREIVDHWALGLEFDASWRVLNFYETEYEDAVEVESEDNPRDIRYRLTVYTLVSPF